MLRSSTREINVEWLNFSSRAIEKHFLNFYCIRYDLISNYNVGLKALLLDGISEPKFHGDFVYKLKKLIGRNDFSFQFLKYYTLQTYRI